MPGPSAHRLRDPTSRPGARDREVQARISHEDVDRAGAGVGGA